MLIKESKNSVQRRRPGERIWNRSDRFCHPSIPNVSALCLTFQSKSNRVYMQFFQHSPRIVGCSSILLFGNGRTPVIHRVFVCICQSVLNERCIVNDDVIDLAVVAHVFNRFAHILIQRVLLLSKTHTWYKLNKRTQNRAEKRLKNCFLFQF